MTPEREAEIRDTWGNLPVVVELLAALDAANAENAALRAERDERWRDWAEAGEVNGTGQPREAQP
jgi:phage portal protein BeeE